MKIDDLTIRIVKYEQRVLSHIAMASFVRNGERYCLSNIIIDDAKDARDALRMLVKNKGWSY